MGFLGTAGMVAKIAASQQVFADLIIVITLINLPAAGTAAAMVDDFLGQFDIGGGQARCSPE